MILGLGTGWMEHEHTMFGYDLGDIPKRFARFEEGLEVIRRLLRSDVPVSYSVDFFRLQDAVLLPRPQRKGGPPIMIGGSGTKRTLPLVARYADIWNALAVTPTEFRECSTLLDEILKVEGRLPKDVRRTVMIYALCGRDPSEFERRVSWARRIVPMFGTMPLEDLKESYRQSLNAFCGPPDELADYVRTFAAAGADEIVLQWFGLDDIEGLGVLAENLLPALAPHR